MTGNSMFAERVTCGGYSKTCSSFETRKNQFINQPKSWWRRGELNRRRDPDSNTAKVLDSLAKSRTFGDWPEDQREPKTAQKDFNNPEKPDRVRSVKKRLRKG
jgi:hypothetical protein